jgi:hypothetical protein
VLRSNLHEPEDCRAASEVFARVTNKWTVCTRLIPIHYIRMSAMGS